MNLHGVNSSLSITDEMAFETVTKHISIGSGKRKSEEDKIYYANPMMYSADELHDMSVWCINTFGQPGHTKKIWNYQQSPDYWFWFYEEKYLAMFVLRWS